MRIWIALVVATSLAHAEPQRSRIVLADPDPALRAAIERTLSPWRIEVVVEPAAPTTQAKAGELARLRAAHFVVWREGGELVVLDQRRNAIEHREASVGVLAPADAAAAALTVKTLMRLEPPPAVGTTPPPTAARKPSVAASASEPIGEPVGESIGDPIGEPDVAAPDPAPSVATEPEFVVQLGLGTRAAAGTDVGVRGFATVLVQPWSIPLRFGVTGEGGSSTDVKEGSFRGTWRDWSLVATASYAIALERWELEPFVGAGVARSVLSGLEMTVPRDEAATLPVLRAGGWVRWREGRWSIGGEVSGEVTPGAPTYTSTAGMSGNPKPTFAVPSLALGIGVFASADFGL